MALKAIPAIDIIDGQCVRLTKGDFNTLVVYEKEPLELAKRFEGVGITRLHLVDLDGAKEGEPKNQRVLEAIASNTTLAVDFGGGLKTTESLRSVQSAGAQQVSIGSIAVKKPEVIREWIEVFTQAFVIICADVLDGKIAMHGWQEMSDVAIEDFLQQYTTMGISNFLCTSIDRDGTLGGVNIDLYKTIMEKHPNIFLIASGGVASAKDLELLEQAQIPAVVIGKAFYEGKIQLEEIARYAR